MREISYGTKPLAAEARPTETAARCHAALKFLAAVAALTAALATTGCFESKVITSKVNPVTPGSSPRDINGVFYALPRTVVKADVPVNRTNKQPGALSVYTPCFFPGENYVVRKESEFAVDADKIRFDTMFIPDTEEVYMIKTKGGKFETRNLEMTLTESGVLVKASAEVTNDTIDIVTGAVKTGAGLLAQALPVLLSKGTDAKLEPEQEQCRMVSIAKWVEELDIAKSGIVTFDADSNPVSIDEAKLMADKRFPDALRDKAVFKSGYDEAQTIFDQIKQFSLRRTSILSSHPSDVAQAATANADSIKLVLEEVDKTVEALKKNYFFGSEATITWNASFRLNPSAPGKMSIDLFTLSKEQGVCKVHVNQGSGTRLDPKFLIKKRCKYGASTCKPAQMEPVSCEGQLVRLDMSLGEDGEGGAGGVLLANRIKSAGLSQNGNRGFYYRIPGRAVAFIKQAQQEGPEKELARAPLSIAQFGEVVSLPASTGGRRTKYTLELFESSGGLKNFVMGSSSLIQQKNIDDLAGAASTLIEAKGERNKAKAPADELQQLERQRKILEEKKKIRDLEKDLTGEEESEGEQTP